MDEDEPPSESEKPRFLLPDGCKDLIDAIRLQASKNKKVEIYTKITIPDQELPDNLPASVELPEFVTVKDLATALHLEAFSVIRTLMHFGLFETINSMLDFKTASLICDYYGVTPHKIP